MFLCFWFPLGPSIGGPNFVFHNVKCLIIYENGLLSYMSYKIIICKVMDDVAHFKQSITIEIVNESDSTVYRLRVQFIILFW